MTLKTGRDIFNCLHIYDEDGYRLNNDRMCNTEGWEEKAERLVACWNALEGMDPSIVGELVEALKLIRFNWAGHSEACAVLHHGKCDCDWPIVADKCDAVLLATADAVEKGDG